MRRLRQCINTEGDYIEWPKQCIWYYSFLFGRSGDANGCVGHPICLRNFATRAQRH
jgi:hypothetical protein